MYRADLEPKHFIIKIKKTAFFSKAFYGFLFERNNF